MRRSYLVEQAHKVLTATDRRRTLAGYFAPWLSTPGVYEKSYAERVCDIFGLVYSDENLKRKTTFREEEHPRDEDGKFTEKDKPRNPNRIAEQIQKSFLENIRKTILAGNKKVTGGDSGVDTGALRDKSDDEQTRFSNEYYDAIRNRKSKSDIAAIAKSTGFSTQQVSSIRDHVFEEIHDLGEGRVKRFDTDWRIAQAWQRLEQGKHTELDIILMNHELLELELMKEYGYTYSKAHDIANEKYPWGQKWREANPGVRI